MPTGMPCAFFFNTLGCSFFNSSILLFGFKKKIKLFLTWQTRKKKKEELEAMNKKLNFAWRHVWAGTTSKNLLPHTLFKPFLMIWVSFFSLPPTHTHWQKMQQVCFSFSTMRHWESHRVLRHTRIYFCPPVGDVGIVCEAHLENLSHSSCIVPTGLSSAPVMTHHSFNNPYAFAGGY